MDKLLSRRTATEDEDFYGLLGCDETSSVSNVIRVGLLSMLSSQVLMTEGSRSICDCVSPRGPTRMKSHTVCSEIT